MATIFMLPVDVFLCILSYLDIPDRIAFSFTCQMFRQMCVDEGVFRKMDLSRSPISTMQRGEMNKFFRDRQLVQHVRELNVNNLRVLNWQMDDQLEELIISICPHLEALHVLDCGISFQRLHSILKEAHYPMALSWSLWDLTLEDIEFLEKSMKSPEGICLNNIKYLHLEMNESKSHIQIAKYLVLACFRDLEELEVYKWSKDRAYCSGQSFPATDDHLISGFPEPSVENKLQHLHSLVVVDYAFTCRELLSDFVLSFVRSKPSTTKWKKLWISPFMGFSRGGVIDLPPVDLSLLLHEIHPYDLQSVEAITIGWSYDEVDKVKTLFDRMGDNTIRSLHLGLQDHRHSIHELCEPISRVAGHSLKFFCVSYHTVHAIPPEGNVVFHTLFSNCSNIIALDLLDCCFEKDICKPLSELKHLRKVHVMQCAVSSKYTWGNVDISKVNLITFVENCKNITHLHVRGCVFYQHGDFSCRLTDEDLVALAKLRNLRCLTLRKISGITEWTFLQNITEHCRFLTMLRIADDEYFNNSHIPILMESSRFLKHLAINVHMQVLESEVFWNLLRHAKNLERLCIRSYEEPSVNVPVAVETIKSLPRLHVLHLHSYSIENIEFFYDEMIKMLEEKESDCKVSFEIVTGKRWIMSECYLISTKALPFNEVELCEMTPVLAVPRF